MKTPIKVLLFFISFYCPKLIFSQCSSTEAEITITINSDYYCTETSWSLIDISTNTVVFSSNGAISNSNCISGPWWNTIYGQTFTWS